MIGRDRELGALIRAVDEGAIVVVQGPAGIGKSALLGAARAHAVAGGAVVLTTAGVQTEAALPFAALERLLHPLLARVARLPAPQRDAMLSGLGLADASVPDHFLIALATLNLLADAGGRVIAFVDDAQWLDAASADVLAFVARRIELEPVGLIVAGREGPLRFDGAELALGPLDEASAATLLERTAAHLPAAARRRVLAVAEGNPLALVELPRSRGHDSGGLSERLERSFTAQQADLAPSARALLRVAAADDGDEAAEILAAAGAAEADLEAAIGVRLLERDGTRVRFRHPLIRSAVYQASSGAERRAAHAAIAGVVTGHRQAWHRAASSTGPDEAIAAALDAAADDARRRGAVAAAVRALQRASELSANPIPRLLGAAELSVELGDIDVVAELIARAEALDPDAAARARIRWLREALAGDSSDDVAPVRALLADAARADDPFKLLLAAGTRCWWGVRGDHPVRDEVVAATLAAGAPADDPRVLAVLAAASAVRTADVVIERLHHASATDPMGMHLLGQAAHMVGEGELAVRRLARAEVQWRAQGRLALLAQALVMRAWSSIETGNWPAVEPAAAEAERLARETGQPLWGAGAGLALAAAAGARGDADRAEALLAPIDVQLVELRATNLFAVRQVACGVTALGAGRYAEAYDQFARMFDPHDPAHHYAEQHGGLSYLAEAAHHCGRTAEARAILDRFAGVRGSALLETGVAIGSALIADSEAPFVAALRGPAARSPFHRARVLLARGAWLRRRRRAADSRAPLRTARDLFDALGTVPWAERARQELRASGERSARRMPEARDQLTPQELQIARMAAHGLSNPEIGERLFLSARTVASHLYRAFPKLGVAGRAELADALRDAG